MNIESISIWLNAFIPGSACIAKGDVLVVVGPPAPLPRFFAGDQREFSDNRDAGARMHSEVRIEGLASENPSIASQINKCGESQEIDGDGNVVAAATASSSRMFFTNLRGSQSVDPEGGVVDGIADSIQIDLVGSAGMPLIAGAPDIDYSGTFIVDRAEGNVLFRGAVSQFPAFEMYFSVNDGPTVTLAQLAPLVPLDLVGAENRPVDASSRVVI